MVLNFHGSKIFAILENYKVYIRTLFMLSSHIGCNTCGWHTFHCSQRVSNPSNRCDIAKISGPSTKWSKIQTFEIFKIHIFTLGMELLRLYARCRSSTVSTGQKGYHVVYIRPTMAFEFHKSFPDKDLHSEAHPQIFCKSVLSAETWMMRLHCEVKVILLFYFSVADQILWFIQRIWMRIEGSFREKRGAHSVLLHTSRSCGEWKTVPTPRLGES